MGDLLLSMDMLRDDLRCYRMQANVEKVKVSIIVTVYNAEKYIIPCLKSLIGQTLKDIEIIVIDDGSTDNSYSILSVFAECDKRIKLYRQKNQGISRSRNSALKLAKGEFIGFCDADDWIDENYYEKLYFAVKKYSSDVAMSSIVRHRKYKDKKWLDFKFEKVYSNVADIMKVSKIPQYSYVWNKIYRKETLNILNVEFPENRIFEDVYWSSRVIPNMKSLVVVPDVVYHYRTVEDSIVSQKTLSRIQEERTAIFDALDFLEKSKIPIFCKVFLEKKKYVNLFGLKLLTIEHYYPDVYLYKLFGFIKFLKIE